MQIVIDIPDSEIPTKQEIVSVDLHFIDGKICGCTYPFEELPAPRIGRWEYNQYDGNPNIGNWHCSECHRIIDYKPLYKWEKGPNFKYCPNCGARMSEENDV